MRDFKISLSRQGLEIKIATAYCKTWNLLTFFSLQLRLICAQYFAEGLLVVCSRGPRQRLPACVCPKRFCPFLPMVQTDSIKMPANPAFGNTLGHLPCVAEEKITRMTLIPRGSSNLDPSIYALNGHVTGTAHLEKQHERHNFRKQRALAFGSQDKLYKGTGVICDPTHATGHLRPYPQEFYGRVYIFYHFQGSSLTLPDLSVKIPWFLHYSKAFMFQRFHGFGLLRGADATRTEAFPTPCSGFSPTPRLTLHLTRWEPDR